MLKKCKDYIKEHKNEIVIGGIAITISVAACVGLKINYDYKIKELADKVAKKWKNSNRGFTITY